MKKLFARLICPGLMLVLSLIVTSAVACSSSTTSGSSTSKPSTTATTVQLSSSLTTTPTMGINNTSSNGQGLGGGTTGTVAGISGNTLTLTTQQGTIMVTLNESTLVQKTVTGSSSDLITGKYVEVTGTADSSGNITGSVITISDQSYAIPSMSSGTATSGLGSNSTMPSGTPAYNNGANQGAGSRTMGTISSISGNNLTVTTMQGEITVTINSSTTIRKSVTGTTADLSTGQSLIIRGSQDSSGNVIAYSIIIQSQ